MGLTAFWGALAMHIARAQCTHGGRPPCFLGLLRDPFEVVNNLGVLVLMGPEYNIGYEVPRLMEAASDKTRGTLLSLQKWHARLAPLRPFQYAHLVGG